jgi:Protein of unknown function (DUF4087)
MNAWKAVSLALLFHKRLVVSLLAALVVFTSCASGNRTKKIYYVPPPEWGITVGQLETRCGWFSNPTPANASLFDRDGEWIIGVQGGYQAEGDWPDFEPGQWGGDQRALRLWMRVPAASGRS